MLALEGLVPNCERQERYIISYHLMLFFRLNQHLLTRGGADQRFDLTVVSAPVESRSVPSTCLHKLGDRVLDVRGETIGPGVSKRKPGHTSGKCACICRYCHARYIYWCPS
jgi:hypothetical protein